MQSNSENIINYMKGCGLDTLFYRSRYGGNNDKPETESIKLALIKNERLIRDKVFESLENRDSGSDFLNSIFHFVKNKNIDISESSFWNSVVDNICEKAFEENFLLNIYNGYRDYAIVAAKMKPSFRWDNLYFKLLEHQGDNKWVRHSFNTTLDMFSKTNTESFSEYAESNVFFSKSKPNHVLRSLVYCKYIERGLLNAKTARKIRSDASSEASASALKALVGSKDKYSNYDDLLLQFTDSKHEQVITLLAGSLPDYLITSILGTEFFWAKRAIEERMERIDREQKELRESLAEGANYG